MKATIWSFPRFYVSLHSQKFPKISHFRMRKVILLLLIAVGSVPAMMAQNVVLDQVIAERTEKPEPSKHSAIPGVGYSGTVGVELYAPAPYATSSFGLTTTHGAMLTERHFLGGGVGLVHDFRGNHTVIPIYAEGRLYFRSKVNNIYPNIALRAGAMTAGKAGTGFYGTLTGGIRIPFANGLGLLAEVGPHLSPKFTHDGLGKPYKLDGTKFGFTVRVSFMF